MDCVPPVRKRSVAGTPSAAPAVSTAPSSARATKMSRCPTGTYWRMRLYERTNDWSVSSPFTAAPICVVRMLPRRGNSGSSTSRRVHAKPGTSALLSSRAAPSGRRSS